MLACHICRLCVHSCGIALYTSIEPLVPLHVAVLRRAFRPKRTLHVKLFVTSWPTPMLVLAAESFCAKFLLGGLQLLHTHVSDPCSLTAIMALVAFAFADNVLLFQVELQSSTALTFPGSTSSGSSSSTYLATAAFTGSGKFSVVALPTVTSSNNCGVFTSPLLKLAVLVASVDATVSTCSSLVQIA